MSDIAETIEYRGFNINIYYDDDPISPIDDWDMLGKMACWHRRYSLGHEQPKCDPMEFRQQLAIEADPDVERRIEYWENGKGWSILAKKYPDYMNDSRSFDICKERCESIINNAIDKYYITLPLYLYDHSGITISTSPFSCPWDSGQVGFIYVSIEQVKKEYNWKVLTKKRYQKIVTYLTGEVEAYDTYLTGQVYGYTVEPKDNNRIECDDSVWGFYGYDHEASGLLESAKCSIDYAIEEYKEQVIEDHNRKMEIERFMKFAWAC